LQKTEYGVPDFFTAGRRKMHRGFEKDYRYLLSHLLPRHLLSSNRLEGILDALAGDSREEQVKEAYYSLEELTRKGYFRRGRIQVYGDSVSVSYAGMGGDRITIQMAQREWEMISAPEKREKELVPSVLAEIISSLSLDNLNRSLLFRIKDILALCGRVKAGSMGYLILLDNVPVVLEEKCDRLMVKNHQELSANIFYRDVIRERDDYQHKDLVQAGGRSFFSIKGGMISAVLIPLKSDGTMWGVLEVHIPSAGYPPRNDLHNYYLIAKGIMRLLENNRHLEEMVMVDRLTQVGNRHYYEIQLPLEIERANRNREALAYLIMDIDDFKQINDRYGHMAGDKVLKSVAGAIRNDLRKIDLFFRFGGEEFVALLPRTDREAAERIAERIKDVVASKTLSVAKGQKINATISIGGCIYPNNGSNEIQLLRNADRALYRSKRNGKNRVTFYQGSI
jgi:diguanylate cyclase (GGDEF)-like protein